MKLFLTYLLVAVLAHSASAFSSNLVLEFQSRWANANYVATGDDQAVLFESLIDDIGAATAGDPSNAELLIWKAIIESTYAGKTSGFEALGLAKSARSALEEAIEIDAGALHGSAYTSLGALYYQVPSWPIAFGSDRKARDFLQKALAINPDGIDPNYFYGEFLFEEKEFDAARLALEKAMKAPDRPERPVADKGRREEIKVLLEKIAQQNS
jgi:tetratricopeptide (TPR) repeat protein